VAYSDHNYATKKAFKDAVEHWAQTGESPVTAHQPGGLFPLKLGRCTIEGPHFPEPHQWYADVIIQDIDGQKIVTKVIS
jgi:hypothetical protein